MHLIDFFSSKDYCEGFFASLQMVFPGGDLAFDPFDLQIIAIISGHIRVVKQWHMLRPNLR